MDRSRETSAGPRPRLLELAVYATGSIGTGIFNTVPSLLLLFYMTDTLALAPTLAAAAVALPKFLAMLTDPLVGALSDRTRSRFGRRRPWLLAGALALPLGFACLFRAPPAAGMAVRFGWVLGAYAVCATAYSVFAVPYVAAAAEMSTEPGDRTVIMSWRMSFVIVGVLAGSAGGPMLVRFFGGGAPGYAGMSALLSLLIGATMLVPCLALRQFATLPLSVVPVRLRDELAVVLHDPALRLLGAAFLIEGVATSTTSAVLPYVVTRVLHRPADFLGGLFLTLILCSLLFMPLWAWIAARIGKKAAFAGAALAGAAAALSLSGLNPAYPALLLYLQFGVIAFGFAGLQMLPFAMITDVIQHDGLVRGGSREGLFSGIWTAIEKAGLALGPMVTAIVLALGGYVQSADGQAVQPRSATQAIITGASVVPALLFAASALLIGFYPLTEQGLAALRRAGEEPAG